MEICEIICSLGPQNYMKIKNDPQCIRIKSVQKENHWIGQINEHRENGDFSTTLYETEAIYDSEDEAKTEMTNVVKKIQS